MHIKNTRNHPLSSTGGFSLMEILIALALVALIAGVTIAGLGNIFGKSNEKVARLFAKDSIKLPLTTYRIDVGSYPSTSDGIQSLLTAPESKAKRWNGPYVEEIPEDPWGNPYQYRYPGVKNPGKYDVWSLGPDGVESADDIGNW